MAVGQGLLKGTWLRLRASGKSRQGTNGAVGEKKQSGSRQISCTVVRVLRMRGTDNESSGRTSHSQGLVFKSEQLTIDWA